MGYIAHHAVIVTVAGYQMDRIKADVEEFRNALPDDWKKLVIGPIESMINNDWSYVFLPDGSKEGWPDSDDGDKYRQQFAEIFSYRHSDKSTPYDVALVRFGGDEPEKINAADPRRDWRPIQP